MDCYWHGVGHIILFVGFNMTEIPAHKHTHSLFVRCLDCQVFGIPKPTRFVDAAECGNCGSVHTVKYYPSCCLVELMKDKESDT